MCSTAACFLAAVWALFSCPNQLSAYAIHDIGLKIWQTHTNVNEKLFKFLGLLIRSRNSPPFTVLEYSLIFITLFTSCATGPYPFSYPVNILTSYFFAFHFNIMPSLPYIPVVFQLLFSIFVFRIKFIMWYYLGEKIKEDEICWACITHGRDEKCKQCFRWKTWRKTPLGIPRHRWVDIIRVDLSEIRWDIVDWMHLAQFRVQRRAHVNTVMNLRGP